MKKSEIKPQHMEIIDKAVKEAFGVSSWVADELLGGGLSTSILYKLSISGGDYVVRISDPEHPHHNLDREYHAMALAAQHQIAPWVYHHDPKTGVLIMAFIARQPLNPMAFTARQEIKKFARFIRDLHNCSDFQKDDSIFGKTDTIFDLMPPSLRACELVSQGMAMKSTLEQLLYDPNDMRPCHGDINPNNLLFDGHHFWLVDWASASQENFYFDLASCATFFFYHPPDASREFLRAYFDRPPTATEEGKYHLMRLFVSIYYGIMFIYLSGLQNTPLLPQEEIDFLPDYARFMGMIGAGKENLADATTQQKLGFVYLKSALGERNRERLADTLISQSRG